jgi:hypothetical protein
MIMVKINIRLQTNIKKETLDTIKLQSRKIHPNIAKKYLQDMITIHQKSKAANCLNKNNSMQVNQNIVKRT